MMCVFVMCVFVSPMKHETHHDEHSMQTWMDGTSCERDMKTKEGMQIDR